MRHVRVYRFALIALLMGATAAAARANDGRLTLTTERVVVFKDGHALVIKRATGTADAEGNVYTDRVPDSAVLGSFWAVGASDEVLSMRAEYTNAWRRSTTVPHASTQEPRPTTPLASLLGGVKGKTVTLVLDNDTAVTGRMLAIIETDANVFANVLPAGGEQPVSISLGRVVRVQGDALPSRAGGANAFERAKQLTFVMGDRAAGKPVDITLMYFTPGMRWVPTYRLSGDLVDAAAMSLQAEVLNELEDFEDVALDLVVGVPNFRFSGVVSPLSLERQLRNALRQAAPQIMGHGSAMSNAAFTQRASEYRGPHHTNAPDAGGSAAIDLPEELAATGEQDLFVYSVPGFTLRRGGRATLPLWQAEAPIEHVYTLDLPVVRHPRHGGMMSTRSAHGSSRVDSPMRLMTTKVWHQLDLANRSEVPWTTGAAMIMRGHVPIGQDLLTYTPPGGRTLLPMTVAVNVRASLTERETDRQANALTWDHNQYALITKEGTVTVTNYTEETITLRINTSVPGKVTEASDDGAIVIDDYHPSDWSRSGYGINNHSDVTWDLELEPGETITRTYSVDFYVR